MSQYKYQAIAVFKNHMLNREQNNLTVENLYER